MADVVETPHIGYKPPPTENELKAIEVAKKTIYANKPYNEILIMHMPNVSDENRQAFADFMAKVHPYLPFSIAIVSQPLECITKEDIVSLRDKLDHICKENGWHG